MKFRTLFTLLSFVAMILASVIVVSRNWPDGGTPFLTWYVHAAALGVMLVELFSRAFKIYASAWAVDCRISYGIALRTCLAGDFAAGVTPARSGAEPARFLVLAEAGLKASDRLLILFLELLLEMFSLVLVCTCLALVFHGKGASAVGLTGLVGGYSVFVICVGAVGAILARHNSYGPPPAWARVIGLVPHRWRRVQIHLRQLRSSVKSFGQANMGRMLLAYAASLLHVMAKVAVLPVLVFLGDRTFELTVDTLAPIVLWPLALFYGGVVVPAPGGGGVIESAFAYTLSDAIPPGIFAASLIWWRFYSYWIYLLAGAVAAGDSIRRAMK